MWKWSDNKVWYFPPAVCGGLSFLGNLLEAEDFQDTEAFLKPSSHGYEKLVPCEGYDSLHHIGRAPTRADPPPYTATCGFHAKNESCKCYACFRKCTTIYISFQFHRVAWALSSIISKPSCIIRNWLHFRRIVEIDENRERHNDWCAECLVPNRVGMKTSSSMQFPHINEN